MAVRKLRDLKPVQLARIIHLQKITRQAWHDRKNPDDGVLNLTAAMEAKPIKIRAPVVAMWAAIGLIGVYAVACVWHVTITLIQQALS
jgi:hypothetical protein